MTRAHAQGLETEMLSYGEAQAISRRIRESGKAISNRSVLNEVRDRDAKLLQMRRSHQHNMKDRQQGRKRMVQQQEESQREEVLWGREPPSRTRDETTISTEKEPSLRTPNQPLAEPKVEGSIANDENELQIRIKPVRVYANYDEIERQARSNESRQQPRAGREG